MPRRGGKSLLQTQKNFILASRNHEMSRRLTYTSVFGYLPEGAMRIVRPVEPYSAMSRSSSRAGGGLSRTAAKQLARSCKYNVKWSAHTLAIVTVGAQVTTVTIITIILVTIIAVTVQVSILNDEVLVRSIYVPSIRRSRTVTGITTVAVVVTIAVTTVILSGRVVAATTWTWRATSRRGTTWATGVTASIRVPARVESPRCTGRSASPL